MAINLQNTSGIHAGSVKMLVYGQAGAGKTRLISTLPNPVILSAESGLLSLAGTSIPYIQIDSMDTLTEAYTWLTDSAEAKAFETVCIDSISEVAEVCLATEKLRSKDPRQAYGEMQTLMASAIRSFRDLPKHVYMSAKLDKSSDEMGRVLYSPSMPGQKSGQAIPYQFDLVLALRVEKDSEGVSQRALMTQSDGLWQAKDRSGRLEAWEAPDLGAIIQKIGGVS